MPTRAQSVVALAQAPRPTARIAIPPDVKQLVWTRDGGACAQCGSNVELQLDHVIPVSLGGSNDEGNLQILCGPCNRLKGASVG
ncbi:MAG TPA: HNH endonuclease [Actinomycetes bacterium]